MVDEVSVPRFVEPDIWPATVPMLQNGWRGTGGPVDPPADQGLLNWPLQELTRRTRWLYERHQERRLDAAITLTVGPGGDHGTLNQALERLSVMAPRLQPQPITATVRLLAGYEMAEQVFVRGINLGWVRIQSDNPTVLIRRSALTQSFGDLVPAFFAGAGGVLPQIAALFAMTTDGAAAGRTGIAVSQGGSVLVAAGCGVQAAGSYGAVAELGGVISAEEADFRSAGQDAVRASRGGLITVRAANLSGAGGNGVVSHRASTVDCESADITGAGTYGITAQRGGRINAYGAQCRRSPGADSSADIHVTTGGVIAAATAVGGTSIAVNTLTANGMILR